MLYKRSGFRPHSSSDPLTRATFPPGEGFGVENPTFLNHKKKKDDPVWVVLNNHRFAFCCSSQMRSTAMSAGLTPEILPA